MLPDVMPTLTGDRVTLRPFLDTDVALVQSVAEDPLTPLITTVPASGTTEDAAAYIARQHDRIRSGSGYSFAIAANDHRQPVGRIGIWLANIDDGRARCVRMFHKRRVMGTNAVRRRAYGRR